MYLLCALFLTGPLLVRGYDDEALPRFFSLEGTDSAAARDRRSSGCDCGEGTSYCFMDDGKRYCECENNILVVDYPCLACSCVNGICYGSSDCRCHKNYGLRGDNNCEPCDCGDNLQCHFLDNYQLCNCWDEFVSVNTRCSNCKCGTNEICFEKLETRTCSCSEDIFIPECEDCDCRGSLADRLLRIDAACSYNATVYVCKCLPHYVELNGTCTECRCEGANTRCDFVNGAKTCSCKEGFEDHNGSCEECFCGEGHSCTFQNGSAVCVCDENYAEHNGTCKECACKEGEICEFVDGKPTCACKENYLDVGGLCKECFCGVGHDCTFMGGEKFCICRKNFADKFGSCEECQCGAGHDCQFQKGGRVCLCTPGYAERDGICVECSCGNDTACLFAGEEKLCFCKQGFTDKNGECVEVCHENTCHRGSCQAVGDTFRCNCDVGFGGERCDEEYMISKEAAILTASLTAVTLFWAILAAVYCVRRRRKRFRALAVGPENDVLMTSTT